MPTPSMPDLSHVEGLDPLPDPTDLQVEAALAAAVADHHFALAGQILRARAAGTIQTTRAFYLLMQVARHGRDLAAAFTEGEDDDDVGRSGMKVGRGRMPGAMTPGAVLEHTSIQDSVQASRISALSAAAQTPGISDAARAAATRRLEDELLPLAAESPPVTPEPVPAAPVAALSVDPHDPFVPPAPPAWSLGTNPGAAAARKIAEAQVGESRPWPAPRPLTPNDEDIPF